MIYLQSGALYDLLPHAPGNLNPLATQKSGVHADGLVGAISDVAIKQPSGQTSQLSSPSTAPNQLTTLPTTEVNYVQFSQKPSGKNKKNKKKTSSSEEQSDHQNNPNQKNVAKTDKGKEKPMNFLCRICTNDHLTYKFPRL